ncbi:MAG: 3'-5' exonuclease domain-containing protein 2 [Muribaculaceae bacterium]|nr:3'-5' exonuclease domain-containing protein 2 [Muribaculaceae bacterium]
MPSSNFNLSIPKQTVAELPVAAFSGDIEVIDTPEAVGPAVDWLMSQDIIGFDTETKPSFRKGRPNKVALMQLSSAEKCCLFRLNKIGLPDALLRFIECPTVKKIGLSIHDDFHVMHRSSEFTPAGFVELQDYVKQWHIADISLQKIFGIVFGHKISKGQRLTNWEADTLTHAQQVYAATDAWACLRLYEHLQAGLFDPAASPYVLPDEAPTK